jgi:hypothetical protein
MMAAIQGYLGAVSIELLLTLLIQAATPTGAVSLERCLMFTQHGGSGA